MSEHTKWKVDDNELPKETAELIANAPRKAQEHAEMLELLREQIRQENLTLEVVVESIKELCPDRKFLSPERNKSLPCSLIIACKSRIKANEKVQSFINRIDKGEKCQE